VLLDSGCICCSIRGDLSRAMRDLLARRQRGDMPPFRRVIVETRASRTRCRSSRPSPRTW